MLIRKKVKEFNARVALGYDVAAEKQGRIAAIKTQKAEAVNVGQIADEYFEKNILGRWKHPNIVRCRIEKDIIESVAN